MAEPFLMQSIFREALYLIFLSVCVCIGPSLVVGLVVSVFQAATQINEQTLSFLPRLLATFATIGLAGPWLFGKLITFFQGLFLAIPGMIQ